MSCKNKPCGCCPPLPPPCKCDPCDSCHHEEPPHHPCPPPPCHDCCKPHHCGSCKLYPCVCVTACAPPIYPPTYYGYDSLNLRRYVNQVAYSNVCYPYPFIGPYI